MTVFLKNVILNNWYDHKKIPLEEGLEITHRKSENNEDYASIVGSKGQINRYLQNADIVSERCRTLKSIPQYRIINTVKERIQ